MEAWVKEVGFELMETLVHDPNPEWRLLRKERTCLQGNQMHLRSLVLTIDNAIATRTLM
jgi:hypothetical protein